jgi:predicted heme/steroid binding protein
MDAVEQASRRFTLEELAQYNGKDGQPCYVAYLGQVYDVTGSRLWRNGVHVRAHNAGEDLTANMPAAPHADDVMARYPVVGVIAQVEEEEEAGPPWWARLSLDNHLHPIAVHFPTALGAVCPVFALAGLAVGGIAPELHTALQHAAFWCLAVCFLGAFPSVITGWISWYFNYASVWTRIYRIKWIGSGVLLVLAGSALALKLTALGGFSPVDYASQPLGWAYLGLLILVAANVAVLGHYGGKITFPS